MTAPVQTFPSANILGSDGAHAQALALSPWQSKAKNEYSSTKLANSITLDGYNIQFPLSTAIMRWVPSCFQAAAANDVFDVIFVVR